MLACSRYLSALLLQPPDLRHLYPLIYSSPPCSPAAGLWGSASALGVIFLLFLKTLISRVHFPTALTFPENILLPQAGDLSLSQAWGQPSGSSDTSPLWARGSSNRGGQRCEGNSSHGNHAGSDQDRGPGVMCFDHQRTRQTSLPTTT